MDGGFFSPSVLSMQRVDVAAWDIRIGAIDSFRVSKIGAGRELKSRTRPAFGWISFPCRELNAFPRSTFSSKLLKTERRTKSLFSCR